MVQARPVTFDAIAGVVLTPPAAFLARTGVPSARVLPAMICLASTTGIGGGA